MLLFLGAGSVMDIRKKEISGVFLIGFLLLGAAVQLGKMAVSYGEEPWQGWIAGAFAGALLLGLARLSGQALGYGDALAAMILGVWLGLLPLAEIFFFGLCLSAVYGAWLFLARKKGGKHRMAFLPFLMGGYVIWLLMGEGAAV